MLTAQIFFWIERLFWEIFVLIGSFVDLYVGLHSYLCFSHLKKLFWKAVLTPPQYLAICRASQAFFFKRNLDTSSIPGGSIEKAPASTIAPRHLLDQSSFCSRIWLFVARYLPTPQLSSITEGSIYFSIVILLSFLRSIRDCSSPKHSPFPSKPLPQGFFKLFQVSPYLVSS